MTHKHKNTVDGTKNDPSRGLLGALSCVLPRTFVFPAELYLQMSGRGGSDLEKLTEEMTLYFHEKTNTKLLDVNCTTSATKSHSKSLEVFLRWDRLPHLLVLRLGGVDGVAGVLRL